MSTPNPLRVSVTVQKTMFGKRNGLYEARLVGFTAQCASKESALQALTTLLENAAQHSHTRHYLVTPEGTTFALYWAWSGWAYDIVHRDGKHSSCLMCQAKTDHDAFLAMKNHFTDYAKDECAVQIA